MRRFKSASRLGKINALCLRYKKRNKWKALFGYTENLEKRLLSHNLGKVRSTKAHKPYKLIYKEEYIDKTEARKREIFLKSGQGREQLKACL